MSESTITDNVFVGTTIGVASGVILALFSWMRERMSSVFERRDQIRYIREVLVNSRDKILGATDISGSSIGAPVSRLAESDLQKAYFEDMNRQLEAALDGRATRLTFDEINAVRTLTVRGLTYLFPSVALNDKGYRPIFKQLEDLEWLKLPRREDI